MQVGLAQCVNKGMQRDYSMDKASQEFAYENHNIRITTTGNESFLSVTNERSTEKITLNTTLSDDIIILGNTVINDMLILFCKGVNKDYIYKIKINDLSGEVILLYEGNLEFSIDNPIECIASYEGDEVLKVYWVDGIKQPRYINVFPDKTYPEDDSFDFTPSIVDGVDVFIEKEYNGTGLFKSGVIQYYITYYKKFGAETNVVYQSPLYYISQSNRGGKVDEDQSCNFRITIQPKTDKYDYIRVYSLIRTSLNNTQVAIVADAAVNKNEDGSFKSIQVIDTNTNIIPVDPTDIMFLGGNTVIASTIEQKDNTLFLGNVEEVKVSFDLDNIKNKINTLKTDTSRSFTDAKEQHLPESILKFKWKVFGYENNDLNSQYDYFSQLNKDSYSIKGFKYNEVYRFGFQLQTYTGEWTQTIYLDDLKCDKYPKILEEFSETNNEDYLLLTDSEQQFSNYMYLPYIWFDPSEILSGINLKEFISYRLVMAEPSLQDRSIVCQGYITPTLYNPRLKNVASWNTKFINDDNKHWNNVLYLGKNKEEQIVPTPKTELDLSLYTDANIELKGYNISPEDYSDGWYLTYLNIDYRCDYKWVGIDKYAFGKVYFTFYFYNSNLGNKEISCSLYGDSHENTVIEYDTVEVSSQRYKTYELTKATALKKTYSEYIVNGSEYIYNEALGKDVNFGYLYDYLCECLKATSISNILKDEPIIKDAGEFPSVSKKEAKSKDYFTKSNKVSRKYNPSYFDTANTERQNHYFIDASTCNIFVPNINEIASIVNDSDLKFRIIGKADFSKNVTSFKLEANDTKSGNSEDYYLDFKFSGNLNEDRKTFGLQSYPLWSSFSRNSDDNPSRYNWTYLWNTGDLSKAGDKLSRIKNKIFANLYYSENTLFTDDSSNKILWETEANKNIKSISDSMIYMEDSIYRRDLDDLLIPEISNKYIYYMESPYTSNFQPYNYEDTKRNTTTHSFDPVKIKYNTSNHILVQFDNYKNRIVTLPGYENKLDTDLYNGNTIDIITNSTLPLGETNYTNMVFQDAYSDKDNYFANNFTVFTGTNYYIYTGDKQFKNNDIVLYFYKRQEHSDIDGNPSDLYYFGGRDYLPPFKIGIYKTKWNEYIQNKFYFVEPRTLLKSEMSGLTLDYFNNVVLPILQSKDIMFNFYHSDINTKTWEVYGKYQIDIITENWSGEEVTSAIVNNYNPFYVNPINVKTDNSIWICELYKDFNDFNPYGGTEQNAIELNTFIPISYPTAFNTSCNGLEGDTYFQRWDSLRTYPSEEGGQSTVDVVSLMLETHTNLDGRSDDTRGRTDIENIRPNNIQDTINSIYSHENNYITSSVLDEKLDDSTHPTLYTWSLTKAALSDVDNWTSINLSRSNKLDGDKGVLTKIKRWNNQLLAFQERGLAVINFNQQTTISTDAGVPVEIAASGLVSGHYYLSSTQGCKNKWSIVDSPYGIYFIDSYNKSINVFGSEGIKSLSSINLLQDWIENNEYGEVWKPYYDNKGFKSFYDPIHKEIYFVNNNTALCYNELLSQFVSFYDYDKLNTMATISGYIYGIKDNKLHRMFEGDTYCNLFGEQKDYFVTYKINKDPFIDKTWTNIEYRADIFNTKDIQDIPSLSDNTQIVSNTTFDKLEVWNEYQYGSSNMSKAKPKFRIWRADIPRDTKEGRGLNRIRNPWIMIKLSKEYNTVKKTNTDKRMEFHDLLIKYLQ